MMRPVFHIQSMLPIKNKWAFIKCIRSSPYSGYVTAEIGRFDLLGVPMDYTRIVAIKVPKKWNQMNKKQREDFVLKRPEANVV